MPRLANVMPSQLAGVTPGPISTHRNAPSNTRTNLLPTSFRLDSADMISYTTSKWTTNALFCVFLLYKLNGEWSDTSYWIIFLPLFAGFGLQSALFVWNMSTVSMRMDRLLGPPPPPTFSLNLHAQYTALREIASRSHVVDTLNSYVDSLAFLAVEIQFSHLLSLGRFASASMRVLFTPIWAAWIVTTFLLCTKHRRDRVFGSQRDITYLFLLMVAFKVDRVTSLPWQVIFVFPWIWLSGVLLFAVAVTVSLSCARGWSRIKKLLLPIGFCMLLWSTGVPHFAFCRNLVSRLEGNTSITYNSILIPAAVGWGAMWLSACILALGLRARERAREAILASGNMWMIHETANRLQPMEAGMSLGNLTQLNDMTENDLIALGNMYMESNGSQPPAALLRVGPDLFRKADASASGTPEVPVLTPVSSPAQHTTPPGGAAAAAASTDHVAIEMVTVKPGAAGGQQGGEQQSSSQQEQQQQQQQQSQQQPESSGRTSQPSAGSGEGQQGQGQRQVGPAGGGQGQDDQGTAEGYLPSLLMANTRFATLFGLAPDQDLSDEDTCLICCDAAACCVMLDCGHGGLCRRCSHLMLVRPAHTCPTCRQKVTQVVQLVNPQVAVGGWTAVKRCEATARTTTEPPPPETGESV